MKPDKALLFLVLLFFSFAARAQQAYLLNLGVPQGLSQSSVYLIHQDKQGFMWFGTADGLNRYDGNSFRTYKLQHPGEANGNSNFYGRAAFEDEAGNMYLSERTGIIYYDRQKDEVSSFYPQHVQPAYPGGMAEVLGGGNDSSFWFTDCGLSFYNYNYHTGKLKRIAIQDPTHHSSSFRLAFMDKEKRIWYSLYHGIGCYDTQKGTFSFHLTALYKKLGIHLSHEVLSAGQNRIIIASGQMVIDYNLQNHSYSYLMPYNKAERYERLEIDRLGRIYIGSAINGLYAIEPDGKRQKVALDEDPFGPPQKIITRIKSDASDNLWIGCDGFGLTKINPLHKKFNLFRNGVNGMAFKSNFIKCLYKKENEIWFGTHDGGLHVLNTKTGSVHVIAGNLPGYNIISCIFPFNEKEIIAGSSAGLAFISTQTKQQTRFIRLPFSPVYAEGQNALTAIFRMKSGSLYAASREGFFSIQKDRMVKLEIPDMGSPNFVAVHVTTDGVLWAGSQEHAYLYELRETKPGTLTLLNKYLKGRCLRCFYEDTAAGVLWIASERGLIRKDLATRKYTFITTEQGLADNFLYAVLPGNNDELWLTSNKGLMCYHTKTGKVESYSAADGLQSNEFNTGSYYRSSDGELFFGGINGFNSFYPANVKPNTHQPQIALTRLSINDEDATEKGNAATLSDITLPYNENTLSFDFSALEFTDPSKNKYQYKLEGIDKNWVLSDNKHFARYSALLPGTYRLIVKASNNDQVWSNETQLISITILPPWWKRWWFVLLVILTCCTGIFYLARSITTRKLKARLRELEKQEAVNRERTRISKDMHDDLGSGLTKIAIMSELLKQQEQHYENGQVEKISKTAGDLIDNMSHIIWAMNPDNDRIDNLLSYLREYASGFFDDTLLRCTIDFPEMQHDLALSQQARRNLFLVYKESLNNIVKHAGATTVHIRSDITGNRIIFGITDNGKGFDPSHVKRFGNGLINMKKRMEDVNGTYFIKSKTGEGTTTELTLLI
jgi:signal transduction histidine kinase/ligand-binding sensor domain-containing protein